MIKFSHTIFALPFALSAVVIAWESHFVSFSDIMWISFAMIGARTAAMGFNRVVDAQIDAKNPRTAKREIPLGLVSKKDSAALIALSSLLFIFSAFMLSKACFIFSIPVLCFLFFYSFTKKFTKYSHFFLGLAISLAPAGAWFAITDSLSFGIIFLCLSLMTYITGFDILYSCQDIEYDNKQNLFSLPSKIGAKKAMLISSLLHCLTFIFLIFVYISFNMHPVFLGFLFGIAVLLILEHKLVKPDNLQHINIAFFYINSIISILLFIGVLTQSFLK